MKGTSVKYHHYCISVCTYTLLQVEAAVAPQQMEAVTALFLCHFLHLFFSHSLSLYHCFACLSVYSSLRTPVSAASCE